jgi:hypothetical protein
VQAAKVPFGYQSVRFTHDTVLHPKPTSEPGPNVYSPIKHDRVIGVHACLIATFQLFDFLVPFSPHFN